MKFIINKGKIIADEKTSDLTRTIEDGYQYQFKICGPEKEVVSALAKINGVKVAVSTGERDMDSYSFIVESERGIDVRKSVFSLCTKMGWAILGISPVGTDLETIFIRLVERSEGQAVLKKEKRSRAH